VPTFFVENFGCRATQADGASIERQFADRGLMPAECSSAADIVVLNSCTVTASADQDARSAIRRVRRENPGARIIVTGCYAQRAPEEVAALPGISGVVGNSHKHRLVELALGPTPNSFVPVSLLVGKRPTTNGQRPPTTDERPIFVSDIFAHTELLAAPVFDASNGRTRPNLKVQDGCDNRCSFCVIPSVRGHSRSLPLAKVIDEIKGLVSVGYQEVVISGINLGRWGRDLDGRYSFEELVRAIVCETSLAKLRISSVEPMDWSDELIALMANSPRIAKHAHVPMQSASDAVLRRMHRKYRPSHYREKLEKIRSAMPDAAIGADVMTGFPGETGAEFEETRRAGEALPFTYLHVFTYSSRPGTPAAALPQVPVQVARERNRVLREIASQKKLEFMGSFIGSTVEAITLDVFDGRFTEALTDNYLKVRLTGQHEPNRWVKATLERVESELIGRVED
jgi:threonylcarbamoyladenosine tRNA methylthiotransferase MtaB